MIESHAKRATSSAKPKLVQAAKRLDHQHSREKHNINKQQRHKQAAKLADHPSQTNPSEICCCRICFHDEILIVEQHQQQQEQQQHISHLTNNDNAPNIYTNPKIIVQKPSLLRDIPHHYENCPQLTNSFELESKKSRKPSRLELSDKKASQKLNNHIMLQQLRTLKSESIIPTNVVMMQQHHKDRNSKSTSRNELSTSKLHLQDIDQNHAYKHQGSNSKKQECAKCQLIIDWTRAQANLASKIQKQQHKQKQQLLLKSQSKEKLSSKAADCSARHRSQRQASNIRDKNHLSSRVSADDNKHSEESEIACNNNNKDNDNYNISECEDDLSDKNDKNNDDELGAEMSSLTDSEPVTQTLEQATSDDGQQPKVLYTFNEQHIKKQHQQHQQQLQSAARMMRRLPQRLSARLSRLVSRSTPNDQLQTIDKSPEQATSHKILKRSPKNRKAPEPPNLVKCPSETAAKMRSPTSETSQITMTNSDEPRKTKLDRLLNEQDVTNLEHALKSHKSSLYVAGCLANLYLTKTKLVDNGRKSSPENDDWQLKQTGVPILTFDSGLAKNRRKRQLKINLAQRESGFVLWSDTIDHLSNYHAHDASPTNFHVMYLSQDHRLMAGLSFDDATCASLFLAQIELVTADPRNISLTGPKAIQQEQHNKIKSCAANGLNQKKNHNNNNHISHNQTSHKKFNYLLSDPSEPVRYTWSTLKRAMRRNQAVLHQKNAASPINCNNSQAKKVSQALDHEEASYLNATRLFGLKSLPALAASGGSNQIHQASISSNNNIRGNKKSPQTKVIIPRKCDISAPCLFQHVIQVSRDQLRQSAALSQFMEATKSGANIESIKTPSSESIMTKSSSAENNQLKFISPPKVWLDEQASSRCEQTQSVSQSFVKSSRVSGSASSGFISASSSAGCASSMSSAASSSSAYSASSFISPANSECGERIDSLLSKPSNNTQESQEKQHHAAYDKHKQQQVARKPEPPLRMQQPPPPPPPAVAAIDSCRIIANQVDGNSNTDFAAQSKIHAMIRELESHASLETVSAKRRLMADIAGRLERTRNLKSSSSKNEAISFNPREPHQLDIPSDEKKWIMNKQSERGSDVSRL